MAMIRFLKGRNGFAPLLGIRKDSINYVGCIQELDIRRHPVLLQLLPRLGSCDYHCYGYLPYHHFAPDAQANQIFLSDAEGATAHAGDSAEIR